MIIKVPIYVEIESIHSELLPNFVSDLNKAFSKLLLSEGFKVAKTFNKKHFGVNSTEQMFSIISKDKALDSLRQG